MAPNSDIKILLVEDSGTMRKMEVSIIKRLGYENLLEAENGAKAMELLSERDDIDLIISDWNMPDKDGYDLLLWVRANQQYAQVPFLMATAQGEREKVAKARDAGVNGLVSKPFTPDELQTKIAMAMEGVQEEDSGIKAITPKISASGKLHIKAAHIQITDHLTLGVMNSLIKNEQFTPQHFDLETSCLASWNQVQDALTDGTVDMALILAPIAMDLYGVGVPLKLVLLAHKNGSIFVRKKSSNFKDPGTAFFKDSVFYIPHRLSVHNMLAHRFFSQIGLKPGVPGEQEINVRFEVTPPIKMIDFLRDNASASGFMVAEPLGTKAIAGGIADLQFLSKQAWPDHPCCVVAARQEIIDQHPEAMQEFCNYMAEAGKFIANKPEQAAEIGVSFLDPKGDLGLKKAVLKNVLTEPNGISTDDLFPVVDDLKHMQDYMVDTMEVGSKINVDEFVDLRFAEKACGVTAGQVRARVQEETSGQGIQSMDNTAKAMLEKEGKYLTFNLDGQEYGINILKIREIIGIQPITPVPRTADYIKGVMNLRGRVITVKDLRLRFGLKEQEYNERTCIVVIETQGKEGAVQTGVIVDAVSEVVNLERRRSGTRPVPGART
jgi:chemotaxis signal transduction protein/ABC-type nitrate/sulfonate/bicarbonate transport system substrate-binding protein